MKVTPKKNLGQNFLTDQNILNKIVNSSIIKSSDNILEVGPGTGSLTSFILKKTPKKIIVVEKDERLILELKKKFEKKIQIINSDILDIDEKKLFNNSCKVFGNLPYNISTKILTKWIKNLNNNVWFDEMFLMFQKEVADRIISKVNTNNYGRISIISQWRLECIKLFDINPGCFYPKPKVKSTLLKFLPKKKYYKFNKVKNLETITNVFFNQRRKKIKKPLSILFKNFEEVSKKINIDLNLRPQNIEPEKYFKLVEFYEKKLI